MPKSCITSNNHQKLSVIPICLAFMLCLLSANAYSSNQNQIFILHSYSQEYPWTKSQHDGFVSTYYANSVRPSVISTEYLDTKRKQFDKAYADKFAEYLKDKYSGYTPDVIYVTDDNALTFALDYFHEIFSVSPIFFSGINDYTIQPRLSTLRITGVFEQKEIAPNLELIKLISDDIKSIMVIGDGSRTYDAIKHEISSELTLHPEINATYLASNQISELTRHLKEYKNKYIFLTTLGGVTDNSGRTLTLDETISAIVQSGDFIILSMEDAYLFDGVLGGYVTSGKQQGRTAANMVLEYQQGKPIHQISVITKSPNEYIFDYRELDKYSLDLPSAILDNATILNKPSSFYKRNRSLILASVITLVSILIVWMAFFLAILSRKNKDILTASHETTKQADILKKVKDTLTAAQQIAHLGNWEWNLVTNETIWSDELFRIFGEVPQSVDTGYEKLLSYIPDNDKQYVKAAIDKAIKSKKPYEIEHKINRTDGETSYVRQLGKIYQNELKEPILLVGTLLDITTVKKNELLELERLERMERYQNALLEWSRVDYKNVIEAFRRATEISAHTLGVNRVSIWLYNDDQSAIVCKDLYIMDDNHSKDFQLNRSDFPKYFKAMETGKMIVINDAMKDDRTHEFLQDYLEPNEIHSMLDAPIFYQGQVIGVVCHEHTGSTREWASHEQEFASAIANTVSLSLEIDKRRVIEKQLEHQAFHDELTGLPNRSLFMDRLEYAIRHAKRTNTLLAVLFFDLDNFKGINDTLGHAVGDQVLINVANNIKNNIRDVDTIARLGGDEFTLIMGSFANTQQINEIAAKLFNALHKSILIEDHEIYISSSMGISIYPDDGDDADTLLRNADAAMYEAKKKGRNCFQFYTQEMTDRAFDKLLIEANLRRALERDEFIIHYHPQYDTKTNTIIEIEALVRWQHPEIGLLSPVKFISVAEETGLIVELDRWVFRTALEQISKWHQQGLSPGRLALNLVMKQLDQDDFIGFIKTTLEKHECKAEWLCFEMTESQIMNNPEKAISVLNEINTLGIEITIDDFGTGYSSLAHLKRLPVKKLKIDQTFIQDIQVNEDKAAVVRAVIALSKSMGLDVVAEGVEQQEQVDLLLNEGCTLIQGYFYNTPMEAEKMELLLTN